MADTTKRNSSPSFASRLRATWRRTGARSLKPTREGRWIIGIALVAGFGAINTGNNLLFFGWGLVLSAIVVSGVLSEATLRRARARLTGYGEVRAGQPSPLTLVLENPSRRLAAFGVETRALIDDGVSQETATARYALRLRPGERDEVIARYLAQRRGIHRVVELQARTRFPFGFFEKTRHFVAASPIELLVFPRRVDTGILPDRILARSGAIALSLPGPGDEFFSLRPFKDGDDPRAVAWRPSARTGRLFVRETERVAAREVVLELVIPRGISDAHVEELVATAGSLAEDLLERGIATGLAAPGVALAPHPGARQRTALLTALAVLDPRAPLESPPRGRAAKLVVTARGAASSGAAFTVEVGAPT